MKQHRYIGVYGVAKRDGCILVTKKGRGPYTGRWDLPGGGLEFGETAEETLRREMREETGLEVAAMSLLGVWTWVIVDPRPGFEGEQTYHIGIVYAVETGAGELVTGADGEDSLGAMWIRIEDLRADEMTAFLARAVG